MDNPGDHPHPEKHSAVSSLDAVIDTCAREAKVVIDHCAERWNHNPLHLAWMPLYALWIGAGLAATLTKRMLKAS